MTTALYRATLDDLFGAEPGASGFDRAEILAAEERIGRALPSTLVEHYVAFGRRSFQRAHDRMMAPAQARARDRVDVTSSVSRFTEPR